MGKRNVYLISLGCPKNLVDSERVLSIFHEEKYDIVEDIEKASTVVINTCSFIKDARNESNKTIKDCIKWKMKRPQKRKLIVFGCLPQLQKESLLKKYSQIDVILGVEPYKEIKSLLEIKYSKNDYENYKGRLLSGLPHSAYIKIAEGCNRKCTFCIIPKIRGPYRSRKSRDIIEEARALAKLGAKEIILVAEDTTQYGKDLKEKINLSKLIRLLAKIKGIRWIRLLYLYPDGITDELISVIANEKKACKYVDMPLQHVSDKILKKMKRGMGSKKIVKLIKKMRKKIKNISIRTAFIIGFPGESNVEFNKVLKFIGQIKFDHIGFFVYSDEKKAVASNFEGKIKDTVKKARLEKAYIEQRKISLERNKKMLGKEVDIIVDQKGIGRTEWDAPEIDSLVYFNAGESIKPGDFARVKITSSSDYSLKGELIK